MATSKFNEDYLPIEEHGIIGNLSTCALIGLDGRIDFMCYPNYDSPTIFASLLDKNKGGEFSLKPASNNFKSKQIYYPNTNILLTRFMEENITEVTDYMPIKHGRPVKALIRKVTAVNGPSKVSYSIDPRFDYARKGSKVERKESYWEFSSKDDEQKIRIYSNCELNIKDGKAQGTVTVNENEAVYFALVDPQCEEKDLISQGRFDYLFNETRSFWNEWVSQAHYEGKWREQVTRSALFLKLMLCYDHGSLVAAPTFGLPEAIGGTRNWDYRYTWVRDTSYTLYALSRLGFTEEARDYLNWAGTNCKVLNKDYCVDGNEEPLEVMYRLKGAVEGLEEIVLDHLEGYKGSKPVRIGNEAYNQKQVGIFGEFLDMLYIVNKNITPISHKMWRHVTEIVEWLEEHWKAPDRSIWEIRSESRVHLYSLFMSWVAFDRAIKIAQERSLPAKIDHWQNIRNEIYFTIHDEFYNDEIDSFVQYKNTDVVDASLLRMPIVDFISATDPKWISTLKRIERDLVNDTLVNRYDLDNPAMDDGMPEKEGSLVICAFWYIENLARVGDLEKARLMFERILSYGNHLGLFSEELSIKGEHLGNFPQALSHLGLINTAINLNRILSQERKTKNPRGSFKV